ncbi:MAG: sulfide/dihydroorotate dehydrogenase-like FAD/NAD-binding protein [Abditibacteriota bacterium]|nr:sulfide/dihydroorotate dehydrogenase-like FAD/NAD-binding protein [Abditibacteriota bacterium]
MIVHADGSPCRLSDAGSEDLQSRVVFKRRISDTITEIEVYAPLVAAAAKPGQFVMICRDEKGERIPLTISGADRKKGTINVIFQAVGRSTIELSRVREGDPVMSVAGPMGHPSEVDGLGRVAVIGGGVGTAIAYPVAKAMKEHGNEVTVIIGARTKELFFLIDEIEAFADRLMLITDDGSSGRKGLVTDLLKELLEEKALDRVLCIGPLPMMRAVSSLTKEYGVPAIASLDPIMIDGTGMCGCCRVTVGGKVRYTCVDGPEFDAHQVDWDELKKRKSYYFEEEQEQKKLALENCQ